MALHRRMVRAAMMFMVRGGAVVCGVVRVAVIMFNQQIMAVGLVTGSMAVANARRRNRHHNYHRRKR